MFNIFKQAVKSPKRKPAKQVVHGQGFVMTNVTDYIRPVYRIMDSLEVSGRAYTIVKKVFKDYGTWKTDNLDLIDLMQAYKQFRRQNNKEGVYSIANCFKGEQRHLITYYQVLIDDITKRGIPCCYDNPKQYVEALKWSISMLKRFSNPY